MGVTGVSIAEPGRSFEGGERLQTRRRTSSRWLLGALAPTAGTVRGQAPPLARSAGLAT